VTFVDCEKLISDLLTYDEEEWLEFKENWFEPHAIGEYISALSNAAAMRGKEYAYLVWGISDATHELTGTSINYQRDFKQEPFQHFLARLTVPDIGFSFYDVQIKEKRIVVLKIPAAKKIPTSFDGIRYIRIGSSKENAIRYPEREAQLFDVLNHGLPVIENTESDYQDLTFSRLFTYYAGKGLELKEATFRKNLGLLTKNGKYNLQAQLLSDNCHMPIRVSIFKGETKASPLFSVKEFGNTCILISIEKILEYSDVLNLVQADEYHRTVERKDINLFDQDAFREALINAFIHNKWVEGNAPMVTVYSNRIEILSRGTLAVGQTKEGFFNGESIPVNKKLSDIFLQLHISERSGRGVPMITKIYGRNAYEFRENSINVTIPLNYLKTEGAAIEERPSLYISTPLESLDFNQQRVLYELRNNPHLTQPQLAAKLKLGKTSVQSSIAALKYAKYIERAGANKNGYWIILK
jgi:predicted HTH transcriptional regulator